MNLSLSLLLITSLVAAQQSRFEVTTTTCSSCPSTCSTSTTKVTSSCSFTAPSSDSCVTCYDDNTNSAHYLNFKGIVVGDHFHECDTYLGCPGGCTGSFETPVNTFNCQGNTSITSSYQCISNTLYTYSFYAPTLCPSNSTPPTSSPTPSPTPTTTPLKNDQFIVNRHYCTSCPNTCDPLPYTLDTNCNFTASTANSSCQTCYNPIKRETVYLSFDDVEAGSSFYWCGTLMGCFYSGCRRGTFDAFFECEGESASWSQCVLNELWVYQFNSPTLCSSPSSSSSTSVATTTSTSSTNPPTSSPSPSPASNSNTVTGGTGFDTSSSPFSSVCVSLFVGALLFLLS